MRCPVCRADNDQGPQCRRCRADLSLLFALETQRAHGLAAAYRCMCQHRWKTALAITEGVNTQRRDQESLRLLAMISLLKGDFASAWQSYLAAHQM